MSTQVIAVPPDQDIWTTSVYSYAPGGGGPGGGLADDLLKVGGWGDLYYSLLKFDLSGLPTVASDVELRLYDLNANAGTPTPLNLYEITQDWNWQTQGTGSDHDRLWWADQPSAALVSTSALTAPTVGAYYYINITNLYNEWQNGSLPNYGIELKPTSSWDNFDIFASSRNSNPDYQPALIITSSSVNHPPAVDLAHSILAATISEAVENGRGELTNANGVDQATGVIIFQDPDTSDRPTGSITTQTLVVKDKNGSLQGLTPSQTSTLDHAFTISPEAGNTNNGKIDWTFSALNQSLGFLQPGDTVTLTSRIQIDDHQGGSVTQDVTVNLVFDPFIAFTDQAPGHPTAADVVGAALQYRGSLWNSDNCTGLVWAVSEAVGQPFGESAAQVPGFNSDPTHIPDQGFAIPPNDVPDQYGPWLTIETSNWQSFVKPGDLVRIPGDANLPADSAGHSFIVISEDSQGHWLVIDNTDPNHVQGVTGPIIVTEHTFNGNPNNAFERDVLDANVAYVSRLESGPSSSFSGATVTGTPGQPLNYGNAAAFLDGSQLQNQTISAGNGNDFVAAGSHDAIKLGQGSDTVQAGSNDAISAGNGSDQITAGSSSIITLGNGNDAAVAGSKSTLVVGNGNDTISVGPNSSVTVGNGNDLVAAGAGSSVTLGNGTDTVKAISSLIHAGTGYDTFVFVGNFGQSTITNFNPQKDTIEFDHSNFASVTTIFGDMSQHGANVVIDDGRGDTLTLTGLSVAQLQTHQNDFHLI